MTIEYNCTCDDDQESATLEALRTQLLTLMGYNAQLAALPPGIAALYNTHLDLAQKMLYRRYPVLRTERWFTWPMSAGVRFYDLEDNADECTVRLDPRSVTWVGISQGDGNWKPLVCGIDPVNYTTTGSSIPSRYAIRQCIEVFPPPSDGTWSLRVKGRFGLRPFTDNDDDTTIDPDAILLLALANLKAHDGAPDAGNYMAQLTTYIGDLVAGSHLTRRYFPGRRDEPNAVPPKPIF